MMNLNKGCIEIALPGPLFLTPLQMNLNKGCIEIKKGKVSLWACRRMNLNKGCIEMQLIESKGFTMYDEP